MNPLAWGVTTKAIVLLSLALMASLALNGVLVKSAWVAYGEAKGEKVRVQLASENIAFRRKEAVEHALATAKREDHTALLTELSGIAERGARVEVHYRTAAAAKPLAANCAPGQERVDSINTFLGPAVAAPEVVR